MPVYRRWAFPKPPKKSLAISLSDDDSNCNSTWNVEMDKKEFMDKVSEWWDAHGTHFNDYNTIQVKVLKGATSQLPSH